MSRLAMTIVCLLATPALALQDQPSETPDEVAEAQPQFGFAATRITLTAGTEYAFKSDFNDTPGNVSVFRQSVGVSAAVPLHQQWRVQAAYDLEHAGYDFSRATGLTPGGGDPFDSLWRHRVRAQVAYIHDAEWTILGGGVLRVAGEDGASFSDSITTRVFGGFLYRITPNFQIGVGAAVVTRLEDSTIFAPLPMIQFTYPVANRLTLEVGTIDGVRLTYEASEEVSVIFAASYEFDDYRLADDGPVPEGVFSHVRIPISATARWTPSQAITLSLTTGVDAFSRYTIKDSQGNRVSRSELDPTLFIGGEFRYRF